QVAKPTVDQPGAPPRSAEREVVGIYRHNPQPPAGRVECDPGSSRPEADDQQVDRFTGPQLLELPRAAGSGQRRRGGGHHGSRYLSSRRCNSASKSASSAPESDIVRADSANDWATSSTALACRVGSSRRTVPSAWPARSACSIACSIASWLLPRRSRTYGSSTSGSTWTILRNSGCSRSARVPSTRPATSAGRTGRPSVGGAVAATTADHSLVIRSEIRE